MLTEDMLLQIFNEETTGKNHAKGQRVLNNDLVSSIDITSEDKLICIDGNVISENLFNEYNTKIEMDAEKKSIFSTYCGCLDYEQNEFKKRNYCCKHLVATFYKALEDLANHPLLNQKDAQEHSIFKNKNNVLSMLLGDEKHKNEIKIEVYINKNQWNDNITAEFKIGLNSIGSNNLYVLKDINQFLVAYYNNIPINYSKNFTFHIMNHRLGTKDKRLITYIEMLKELEKNYKYSNKNGEGYVNGKYINIPKYLVREFFEVIRKHRVYLNEGFFYRAVETEVLLEAPAIEFDLKTIKNNYVLKSPGGMPQVLGSKNDVFLYGSTIYLPDYEFCYKISPYLKVFNQAKVVTMEGSEEENILRRLIPDLNLLSPKVTLSKSIKDKIVMDECQFNFYFDKEGKDITLTVKVEYGQFEFNIFEECKDKIIYRDSKKEVQVIGVLRTLGFQEIEGKFYFLMGDDYIFRFFKSEVEKLQEIGAVYYSENFKGLKSIGTKGIKADIKSGKYNYFEMDFKIGDIDPKETSDILRAFRDNLKYYKLPSGEYLDLEELELKKFLKLLDVVSSKNIDDNHIEIYKNKGAFIDNYLEENGIRYIKGKKELNEIRDKFKNIEKLKFKEPVDLNGNLREYQKVGYNWFKTLDYLGFGGILGDEMGLGKTLQTITFILSNKGSKSLIIAPTSLIYNWISEFEKFAPTLKVAAVNGSKEQREDIVNNIENYDVVITTYNLLKRDLETYNTMEFDYCILDEAQNIKNPNSQNAIAVKGIKAKTRFALSGTPIENSLMELWSIFDFIMPGYLYDEKRFSVRYHKKLKEGPEVLEELNKLIKPFILRRRKKDVIKELPDKIEKTLMVTLDDEQKKVYKTYANYAVELIEKKVKDDEFKNSKIEILSYITKLRQLCLDPTVLMDDYSGGNGKLEALTELLNKSIEQGHRILIFSQFTSVLKNIGKRIAAEEISFSYLDGSISSERRMNIVKAFNEGENSVFLISLKAGGTGLNLTSADIVIHFDPWWNPAVEQQATDRAHRIGQKNVVEVIKIIAKGTIEEKILSLQEQKKKLISELMGDELSSGESFTALTDEEILGLFEM
ncbi:SNF2 helicase associated domain-containing protein [Clostridium sp. DJ247]|uniref:SNF2 helicase associated domain-containing protein n=1 Tax=Clostridium sp. DJ247 TaxID=2726188 RepID=UPI001626F76E|nr:SNF2 helicase associated domain-containing protein [Clostridium sp. DJ247]MBC2581447.1 DEAD/DEAH box helicase [Clostridium sp. DJ247]